MQQFTISPWPGSGKHGVYIVTKLPSKRYPATLFRSEVWVRGTQIFSSAWGHDRDDVLAAAKNEIKSRNKRCAG